MSIVSIVTPRGHARQAGITLVELLISIAILGVVSTMLVSGWISLQDSYGYSVTANDASATARDAVAVASRALRAAQPPTLATPAPAMITAATPTEVDFYSAFANTATTASGSGLGAVRLMRIYLDTGATGRGPRGIALAAKVFGGDRILFGSDYGPWPSIEPFVAGVAAAEISADEKKLIYRENGHAILKARGRA